MLDRAATIKDPPRTDRSRDQVLGEPTFIQEDPRIYADSPINGWKLLLSVHDHSEIGLTIDDAGALYYFISDQALQERDWASVRVEVQSQ